MNNELAVDDVTDMVSTAMHSVAADAENHEHGEKPPPMWFSSPHFDGHDILTLRRPELTGDMVDALIADLDKWVEWLVVTFRQQSRIPPCWARHGGLREELLALFFLWQHAWIPAREATLPAAFLRELDTALNRIDRNWKVPCDATTHQESKPVRFSSTGVPDWAAWWSNPDFADHEHVVAELQARRPEAAA